MQYNFTLQEAKSLIEEAGEKVGAAFEDESMILADSQRTIPGTYGHPALMVQLNKRTGWLVIHGRGISRRTEKLTPLAMEVGR